MNGIVWKRIHCERTVYLPSRNVAPRFTYMNALVIIFGLLVLLPDRYKHVLLSIERIFVLSWKIA